MVHWRNNVDKTIKDNLELQIKEASKHKDSYKKAKNPANAQLWVAIANLSRQIFDLNLKLNFLEKALQEIAKPKQSSEKSLKPLKKSDKEIKTLKKTLKKF